MRPYLDLPVFQPLKNPSFFALASVSYGTVVWPGDIDIAPETLYNLSRGGVGSREWQRGMPGSWDKLVSSKVGKSSWPVF